MKVDVGSPLAGTVVVDFSTTLPGPYCSSLLLRLGARVFAMEPPGGDSLRLQPTTYAAVARGKESVVVDLKDPSDRELAVALARNADVVLEGWRPGVAGRLGVSYGACSDGNPKLVYCSLSGFGATGPLAGRAAHDMNFLAEVGATAFARDVGLPLGDLAGAMMATIRVLAALSCAQQTGVGAFVDVSSAGAVWDWVQAIGGASAQRFVDEVNAYPHYGRFLTADGAVAVIGVCSEDKLWTNLANALGLQELADLGFADRLDRGDEVREVLTTTIASLTRPELEAKLRDVDTAWNFERHASELTDVGGRLRTDDRHPPDLDDGRDAAVQFLRHGSNEEA